MPNATPAGDDEELVWPYHNIRIERRHALEPSIVATKHALLGAACVFAFAALNTPAAAQRGGEWNSLERVVAEEMSSRGIPGLVIVVGDGARTLYSRAFGLANAASGEPLPAPRAGVPTDDQLRALEGVYEARFSLELRWREGRLWLTRFGSALPVTALGGTRYSVQPPGSPAADLFTIVPARDGWPPYIQMFLWAFPRVRN